MKYKSPDKRTKLYKAIDKNGTVMVSKKLYDNQLAPWIQKFLESKKHKIQPKAAQLMADHLGNDLSRIANECEKLLISLKEGEEITSDLVAANIGISKDFNVFELQAALSSRDMLKANRIVNYFRANPKANPFVMTIAILFAYFSKILLYHTLQDKTSGAVAGALKISPGFADEYRRAASVFSFEKTTEVISLLREYDLRSKGVNNAASEGDLLREMIYRILH
jgi:DNA polymerase III subunit delta